MSNIQLYAHTRRLRARDAVKRYVTRPNDCCRLRGSAGITRVRVAGFGHAAIEYIFQLPLAEQEIGAYNMRHRMRGGAVWQLVGLITRRSQVRILPPLPYSGWIQAPDEGLFFYWRPVIYRRRLAGSLCRKD